MSVAPLSRFVLMGLCLAFPWLSGCGGSQPVRTFSSQDDVEHAEEHAHDHGPHGGHVVELGGEDYHAEVVFDAATRKLTVYLLGADLKTPLPVEAENLAARLKIGEQTQEFLLAAAPQEGEEGGKSSRFTQAEGSLPESIQDAEDLHGEVVVSFGGTQYRGEITHDHHPHP